MMVSNFVDIEVKYGMTVAEVIEELQKLPGDAKFDVYQTKYYNQFDSGTKGMKISWTGTR